MKRLLLVAVSMLSAYIVVAQSGVVVERNPIDNTVSQIVFPVSEGPRLSDSRAIDVLLELEQHYGWQTTFENSKDAGIVIKRCDLLYKGLEVEHGSVTFIAKNDRISFVNANIFKDQQLSATPVLTEQQALKVALDNIGARQYAWEQKSSSELTRNNPSFQYPKAKLVWVEDFTITDADRKLHLAYKFDIYAQDPLSRDDIYIDARTGKVLLKDPVLKHVNASGQSVYSGTVSFDVEQKGPNNYEMNDLTKDIYTYTLNGGTNLGSATSVSNSSTSWNKSVAVDAHWGATVVYDYWKNKHNRDSYDDQGSDLNSVVNYGNNYNNANWNGFAMIYGNGTGMFANGFDPLVALDVCAHEIGHGVCEYTSDLVYSKEAGAMNEAFSDIWGAVIEHYGDSTKQMWSIGEELGINGLRSMSNPKLAGDPNTYDGQNWVTVTGCSPHGGNDYCGVHTNSGVLNYWFYLLVEGGEGTNDNSDAYEVSGIGIDKAAEIAYATEQVLTKTATYAECRTASINYTATKYGQCSREAEAVARAWYAVGVGSFVPCAPQVGFSENTLTVNKQAAGTNCPASQQVQVALRVTGNAPVGGNATVQLMAIGNALSGVDYSIPAATATFNAGSTAPQSIPVTIFDNGDINKDKQIVLYTVITQNGSNLTQSYTYDTCYINIVGARRGPDTAGTVNTIVGKADLKSKAISPFFSRNRVARNQFIITAEELIQAGLQPNLPINALEFFVSEKHSNQPFSNFTLKIEPTALTDLTSGVVNATTQYYSGSISTQAGWNKLTFTNSLIWNGTDNLAIETCFTNVIAGSENDYVLGSGTNTIITSFRGSDLVSNGCAMSFSGAHNGLSKPVVRLSQSVASTEVEQVIAKSRQWDVYPQQDVFFRSSNDAKLIARLNNAGINIGCTDAGIVKQGKGMVTMSAPFAMANRSEKEFGISVTKNAATATYDLTLYFDTSELSVTQLGNVRIVSTTALQDSLMDTSNTKIIIPVSAGTTGYYSFKGSFTGVKTRYYLIDRDITLPVPQSVTEVDGSKYFKVVNNPFANTLYLNYDLPSAMKAKIKLVDVTGKQVYSAVYDINKLKGQIRLDVGYKLAAGAYFLQVQTSVGANSYVVIKQ